MNKKEKSEQATHLLVIFFLSLATPPLPLPPPSPSNFPRLLKLRNSPLSPTGSRLFILLLFFSYFLHTNQKMASAPTLQLYSTFTSPCSPASSSPSPSTPRPTPPAAAAAAAAASLSLSSSSSSSPAYTFSPSPSPAPASATSGVTKNKVSLATAAATSAAAPLATTSDYVTFSAGEVGSGTKKKTFSPPFFPFLPPDLVENPLCQIWNMMSLNSLL